MKPISEIDHEEASVRKCITITPDDDKWIRENKICLSRFVRWMIRVKMKEQERGENQ